MPLPLGHTAIGLATYETFQNTDHPLSRWKIFIMITLLANLPDLDIVLGLILQGNGNAFHRGPTHSLLFALLAGAAAANLWRWRAVIPRLGFPLCFGLVFSHVLADMVFTAAPVSLFWPLQVYWSTGFSDWETVFKTVLFHGIQDGGIIAVSMLYVGGLRLMRFVLRAQRMPVAARRRAK